jgi:hypothetical protein
MTTTRSWAYWLSLLSIITFYFSKSRSVKLQLILITNEIFVAIVIPRFTLGISEKAQPRRSNLFTSPPACSTPSIAVQPR